MRGLRLGLLLAGTAVAVVLAARGAPAYAATPSDKAVESLVPVPDTSPVPPPTAKDVAAPPAIPAAAPATSTAPAAPAEQPAAATPALAPAAATPTPVAAPAPAAATATPAAEPAPAAATATPAPAPATATATPAAEPAAAQPAAAPAPAIASIDQQVADKLREILPSKADHPIEHRSKAGVEAFYKARNYAPLWIEHGAADERAKAVATFLAHVDADGLDPSDYPLPTIKPDAEVSALAEAELRYTQTVLTYARHAQIGRVHFSRISPDISFNLVPPEPAEVLGSLVDASDIADALERFEPQHAGFKALKAKLAEIRAAKSAPAAQRIGFGPVLRLTKAGMKDLRVPLVRERLGLAGESASTTYDKPLAEAVKKFQESHHLAANGHLTTATVEALNGPRRDREADIIIANMERWRWLPRNLGRAYVMVNIPDFTLKVVKDGKLVWKTKIVTGAPGTKATPLLSETMKYITVNPTWNVPPSIINNEYLPALQQDPTVLERMGLKLEHNRDGTIRIYQPPGAANALGRIRFNFPNKFLVYQHDTPDKYLFARAVRDYSHGCMRVQDPDKYAEVLLSITNPGEGYSVERIHRMYGTGEVDIHMKTPIWVHLTYQTAFVDDEGRLQLRNDIYGRDAKYFAIMKSEERKVADIPIETHNPTIVRAPRMPNNFAYANGGGGGGGPGLFGWLFGGESDRQSSRRQTTYR